LAQITGGQKNSPVVQFQPFQKYLGLAGQLLQSLQASLRKLITDELDLVELMNPEQTSRVLSRGPGLPPKTR
jgi:hypothetical protein